MRHGHELGGSDALLQHHLVEPSLCGVGHDVATGKHPQPCTINSLLSRRARRVRLVLVLVALWKISGGSIAFREKDPDVDTRMPA